MFRPWICLAAGLAVLVADRAEACTPDPCADTIAFVGLARIGADHGDEVGIPTDGVVVMQAQWFGELEPEALLAGLTLTVEHEGAEVAGAVELVDRVGLRGVVLWRPAEPLLPGATYELTGTYVNADGVPSECAAKEVELGFEFMAAEGPSEPMPEPQIWSDEAVSEFPVFELDTIVCCDGAYPYQASLCGNEEDVAWSAGVCVSAETQVRLSVNMGVATILDNATSRQWARTLYQDGEELTTTLGQSFSRQVDEPGCFTIEQFSLATGESFVTEERCFGEDLEVPLGDLRVNPTDMLVDMCKAPPYICEINEDHWVVQRCEAWSLPPRPLTEPAGDEGCGCTSGRPDAALALLGLVLLVRRRRR